MTELFTLLTQLFILLTGRMVLRTEAYSSQDKENPGKNCGARRLIRRKQGGFRTPHTWRRRISTARDKSCDRVGNVVDLLKRSIETPRRELVVSLSCSALLSRTSEMLAGETTRIYPPGAVFTAAMRQRQCLPMLPRTPSSDAEVEVSITPMRTYTELPFAALTYLERVRSALRRLGCASFIDQDEVAQSWVSQHYPHWVERRLFPFFLTSGTNVPLSRNAGPAKHLIEWFGVEAACDGGEWYEDAPELHKRGYLRVGSDTAGSYVAIDTHSQGGMDVLLIDGNSMGSWGFSERFVLRTGRKLDVFLEWIHACPNEFAYIWDRHTPPEEE